MRFTLGFVLVSLASAPSLLAQSEGYRLLFPADSVTIAEADQRAISNFIADHIVEATCTINGIAVDALDGFRFESPQFDFTAPDPWIFGPAGAQLSTRQDTALCALLGRIDYPVGVIAGDRSLDPVGYWLLPGANDGRVSVASTRIEGIADHITLHVTHTMMMRNPEVIRQTLAFLRQGRFERSTSALPRTPA